MDTTYSSILFFFFKKKKTTQFNLNDGFSSILRLPAPLFDIGFERLKSFFGRNRVA